MNDPRQETLRDAETFRNRGLRFPVRHSIPDAFPAARNFYVGVELGLYRLSRHAVPLGIPVGQWDRPWDSGLWSLVLAWATRARLCSARDKRTRGGVRETEPGRARLGIIIRG